MNRRPWLLRLEWRVASQFVGLLLLVQAINFALVSQAIEGQAQRTVREEIERGQTLIQGRVTELREQWQASAARGSHDEALRSALARDDALAATQRLRHQQALYGAEWVGVVDLRGQLRAASGGFPSESARQSHPIESALPSLGRHSGLAFWHQRLSIVAQSPIGERGDRLVVVGALPDKFWSDVHRWMVPELLVIARENAATPWTVLAQAIDEEEHQTQLAEMVDAATKPWVAGGQILVGGVRHGVRAIPLSGALVGADIRVLLMQSLNVAKAEYQGLHQWVLFLGALGAALFVVGGWWVARRLALPIQHLSEAAAELERGDYASPIRVDASGEVEDLAHALDAMREAVRTRDAQVRELAYVDRLTGLPNREAFRQSVTDALKGSGVPGRIFSEAGILLLNLDRFKHVNDALGTAFGDRVLQAAAHRLELQTRREGTFAARMGSDEFAVLLPGADRTQTIKAAQAVISSFSAPLVIDEQVVDLSAGIGMALYPDHGSDADTLVSHAEQAMSVAKQGAGDAVMYDAQRDHRHRPNVGLLSELRRALACNELRLHLQPKVCMRTARVVGAEALVRWHHPRLGQVPPVQFIPFAEKTGFIRDITRSLLGQAARLLASMADRGIPLKISVNLSTRDLADPELPEHVLAQLQAFHADPQRLCLEITESAIMDDPQRVARTLHRLKAMGVSLSIDDFGTGYSSLAYLKRLPVDELKIDRSFVQGMEADIHDAKIVHSTIDLAHNLGLRVVAEGVETDRAWTLLKALQCDEVQGYFIARPMDVEQFVEWMGQWQLPDVSHTRIDTDWASVLHT